MYTACSSLTDGLYWRALPKNTQASKLEKPHMGGTYVGFIANANANGNHLLKSVMWEN